MPRITHLYYSAQREQLCQIWAFSSHKFSLLTPKEQWDLHKHYALTEDMTGPELRLHRRLMKRVDPSLPQRAGRAYAKLQGGDWSKAGTILGIAMERHGLTPSWAWPQVDPATPQRGSDSSVRNTKPGTDLGK